LHPANYVLARVAWGRCILKSAWELTKFETMDSRRAFPPERPDGATLKSLLAIVGGRAPACMMLV